MEDRRLPWDGVVVSTYIVRPHWNGGYTVLLTLRDHWTDKRISESEYRCDDVDTLLTVLQETTEGQYRSQDAERLPKPPE